MTIVTDLKEAFRRGNIHLRLIYVNAAVFVLITLAETLLLLFNRSMADVFRWLELPASLQRFVAQPWSLLTYMFMHVGLIHLLFNMLWLYSFGALFLHFFSARHLRGVYLLGGICGGLLYMAAYNIFPYFASRTDDSFLLGASASVLAIVAATAYRQPDYPVRLFLFGTIRLKYLAGIVIGADLLLVGSANAGGHIAHLGGALAGLWFAARLAKGTDLVSWINQCIDGPASLFASRPRKPRMKVRPGAGRRQEYDDNACRKARADEVDRILDKLRKSGYDSLTPQEKQRLFDAGKH